MKFEIKNKETGKIVEIELSEEQVKELGIQNKKKNTGWERVDAYKQYYSIDEYGDVDARIDSRDCFDDNLYNRADYFSTQEKGNEIDEMQTLWRKMWRFADENNECEIDWEDKTQNKYYFYYDYEYDRFEWSSITFVRRFNSVYFTSLSICKKALEIFEDEIREVYNLPKKIIKGE